MVDVSLIIYSPPPATDCTAPSNINWRCQQSPATEIIETALRNIYKILKVHKHVHVHVLSYSLFYLQYLLTNMNKQYSYSKYFSGVENGI